MDKLTIIVEAILISIIIMIAVFALLPFEFTGSRLIDGYNITFQERCGAGNESLAFYNYSSCVGWTSEINDINLVSGQTILQTYTTCVHEKWHNLITNMTRIDEEKYIVANVNDKTIPPYDETCFKLVRTIL